MSSVTQSYGANSAFIEELYERYRANPDSVSASWREFFGDYAEAEQPRHPERSEGPGGAGGAPPEPTRSLAPARDDVALRLAGSVTPLRGAAGKIAANMEASLAVPTATSVRNIPVKVLEENRRIINNHLALSGQPKASYTHIVAWAIVKAIKGFPRM